MRFDAFARAGTVFREPWRRWRRIVGAGSAGAFLGAISAYFVDPDKGRARRQRVRDRLTGGLRHGRRRVSRELRVRTAHVRGHARGLAHRLRHAPPAELDDTTLAHKVESILFRHRDVPKGSISINAERGIVFLRGEVESAALIDEVERTVQDVAGVHGIQNLLHVPGTSAPHPRAGARGT